jgi:hypothetical protein
MSKRWMVRCVKTVGAMAVAAALSGCIIAPGPGPRYGYYWHPHPHYYY